MKESSRALVEYQRHSWVPNRPYQQQLFLAATDPFRQAIGRIYSTCSFHRMTIDLKTGQTTVETVLPDSAQAKVDEYQRLIKEMAKYYGGTLG